MALFPAFTNNSTATKDGSGIRVDVSRPVFPSTSTSFLRETDTIQKDPPSFSFSFDAQKHSAANEAKVNVPEPPEITDVLSSDDEDVVVIGTHIVDDGKAERKRERKHEKKKKRQREKEKRVQMKEVIKIPSPVTIKNPKIIFLKDSGLKPEEAYCLDPNADKINLTFDSTYWKNVPKYRRPPRWMLGPRKDRSVRRNQMEGRYFQDSSELRNLRSGSGRRLVAPVDAVPFGRNYVPLPDDADMPAEDVEEDIPDEFRDRTATFNEKLRNSPSNVELWLEFLRFQDDVARNYYGGGSEKEDQAKLTHNGLLERKVSILERAIESNPDSVDLQFRRLEMCEDLWDSDQLNNEWRKFAFSHPSNPVVWKRYLFFLQSFFTTFSFPRIQKAYEKLLALTRGIHDGTFQSHKELPNHDLNTSFFPTQLSELWMQSGHQEKAIALQQAVMELNLYFPSKLNSNIPLKDALDFMEPFWDSGVPRFGEKNALGWTNSMTGTSPLDNSAASDFSDQENSLVQSASTLAELWMKLEKFRQEHCLVPYHGTDDIIDPERLVLFDDIRPFLFRFPRSPANEHIFFGCVVNFLVTLRCPLLRNFSTESRGWQMLLSSFEQAPLTYFFSHWTESNFSAALSDSCCHSLFSPFHLIWNDQDSVICGIFEQAVPLFTGIYSTYLSISWLRYKLIKFLSAKPASAQLKKDLRALAKSLLKRPENRNNLLIWEWYAFMEGQLEASAAAANKVLETVLQSAPLKLDDLTETVRLARIVRYYAENCLAMNCLVRSPSNEDKNNSKNLALNVLISYCESRAITFSTVSRDSDSGNDAISDHNILRCRIAFNRLLQHAEDMDQANTIQFYSFGSYYCNVARCFAVFEYLCCGLDAGLTILQNAIQRCKFPSAQGSDFDLNRERSRMDWEILTEATVKLAAYHQRNFTLSSSEFRKILMDGLRDFPNNPELLTIYTQSEALCFLRGGARSYFEEVLERATTTVPWIFALYAEYQRKYRVWRNLKLALDNDLTAEISLTTFKETGISNKLRSLFEQAAESPLCRHSPLIWRMYLKFEMDEENLKRAEGITFRAMQACPWAKSVFMDTIKHFAHRVQETLDVMLEKGLRVMAPFDEVELLFKSNALSVNSDQNQTELHAS